MKHIIPVMSGKGGVGKSTVAVNLSIELAKLGAKVALVDADFYGPSIPTLFGGGEIRQDNENKIIPPEKFGVKYMSIGFFLANPDDPIVWRGPMFTKALQQMFADVSWGEVDYCVVDMPPGTGDAALSLAQMVQLRGAVVVTTPQEVAMADVRKAINMLPKVNVELLGIVENMAGFSAPDGNVYDIFGSGGGEEIAKAFKTDLLARIPIDMAIRVGGDEGQPISVSGGSEASKEFATLALNLQSILDKTSHSQERVSIVN